MGDDKQCSTCTFYDIPAQSYPCHSCSELSKWIGVDETGVRYDVNENNTAQLEYENVELRIYIEELNKRAERQLNLINKLYELYGEMQWEIQQLKGRVNP